MTSLNFRLDNHNRCWLLVAKNRPAFNNHKLMHRSQQQTQFNKWYYLRLVTFSLSWPTYEKPIIHKNSKHRSIDKTIERTSSSFDTHADMQSTYFKSIPRKTNLQCVYLFIICYYFKRFKKFFPFWHPGN